MSNLILELGDIYDSENHITQKGLDESSATLFPEDTVLVAMYGATAGDVGILKIQACTNQAVCGIYPNDEYLPEFLYQIIKFQREHLLKQKVGNAQPNLSQTKIKKLAIPVLPVVIQNKIVCDLSDLNNELNQLKKAMKISLMFRRIQKFYPQKSFCRGANGAGIRIFRISR